MGRLAIIGMEKNIDLEYIFTYPLTPVPLSLFSPDGTMTRTDKSSLLRELEKRIVPSQPDTIDAAIIDGPYMLHLIAGKKTGTYSQLSRTFLLCAVRLSKARVDIVFDNYQEHSLKDAERCKRNASNTNYVITGPEQRCPRQLKEALKSNAFKQMLPIFFAEE